MKVKYFHDTATALIEFSAHAVAETKKLTRISTLIWMLREIWLQ